MSTTALSTKVKPMPLFSNISGENVHQAGMLATLGDDLPDALLFAEVLGLADELDLKPVFSRQLLGVLADLPTQRLRPFGVIEDPDVPGHQKAGHRTGMADLRKGSRDYNAVKTGQDSMDPIGKAFREWGHDVLSRPDCDRNASPCIKSPCLVPATPG